MIDFRRPLQLTEAELSAMKKQIALAIQSGRADPVSGGHTSHPKLTWAEEYVFLFKEAITLAVSKFRGALTSGRLGKLQRKIRRKQTPVKSDYWDINPALAWDYLDRVNPVVVAYDNSNKCFLRQDYASYQKAILSFLSRLIEEVKPSRSLDLGCGYGRVAIGLIKSGTRFPSWIGLDYSPLAVLSTVANFEVEGLLSEQELICGDFKNTGLAAKSVDLSYSVWSLPYGCMESPSDMEDIATEIMRITKKRFIFIEPDFVARRWRLFHINGFFNLNKFCSILKSRGCTVTKTLLPIQINWQIPLYAVSVDLPSGDAAVSGETKLSTAVSQ